MTEYSVEKFYGEYAIKQEDTIIAVLDSGTNARKVCDLLNEQDKEIKRLKTMNNELIEIIQGISRESAETISKLWTGDVE